MNSSGVLPGPRRPFFRFGLIVTGEGEAAFLPEFFQSVSENGRCSFEVIRRIDQRSPRTSPKVEHGRRIVGALRMRHVLSRSDTCAFLRTMFGWICKAVGEPVTGAYRLRDGHYSEITKDQIGALRIRSTASRGDSSYSTSSAPHTPCL